MPTSMGITIATNKHRYGGEGHLCLNDRSHSRREDRMMGKDYYVVLGINRGASDADLKRR